MNVRVNFGAAVGALLLLSLATHGAAAGQGDWSPGPAGWKGDLTPITAADWNYDRAAHLLSRAGFGGTPEDIQKLADMTPEEAVRALVEFDDIPNDHLQPFEHSGFWDESLVDFPPSRPAATELAMKRGESMGVRVKPETVNRHMQPVSDRFFYWLRATQLETRRVSYWWAERMLDTHRPLEEKMALFWHGHFATAENKVRDYRKMLLQIDTFERHAAGNFRDLVIAVAQDPAMLYYLDAGVNVKGAANENFAREVMELFTMGVGNYSEMDVREAARAFTGWNFENLEFVVHPALHDEDEKTFLGRTGNFDGVDVLDIILEEDVTAEYIGAKIYRFFVREDPSEELVSELGAVFRDNGYELRPLLTTMLLSRDFYSEATYGAHIKGPVEHVVTLLKHLGAEDVPGVPDFNRTTIALGQHLLNPPSVAGWAQGKSWITPALIQERGNVAFDYLFPDLPSFVEPNSLYNTAAEVGDRLRRGYDFLSATALDDPGTMSMFDMAAKERDELFNTRISTYRGYERAMRKLIPTPRGGARIDMTQMILDAGAATTGEAVDYLLGRYLRVPLAPGARDDLVAFLEEELGTSDIGRAQTYMEDPLRMVSHLIMSTPEYQIN
jgi:uncharacterized protein (DUF1800 family)